MIRKWRHMKFWTSGEYDVIRERLSDCVKAKKTYNPRRLEMFRSLSLCPFDTTKVMFLGSYPYPDPEHATGLAFSVPPEVKNLPPTLKCVFDEYVSDLHHPYPENGNLEAWSNEGVLLWNVVPSCQSWHATSHDFEEYNYLTAEIIDNLKEKGCVFVFFGSRARLYASRLGIDGNNPVIDTA